MNTLIKLYDATVETIARPLTHSMNKGSTSNPKFRQTIVKIGQTYHDTPVAEEKAIQTAANAIIRKTTKGAYYLAWVYGATWVYLDIQKNWNQSEKKTSTSKVSSKNWKKAEQELNEYKQLVKVFQERNKRR